MCYNQTSEISTLDGTSLKLVDKFTYRGSSVSSTEKGFDTRLTKAWTTIDRLLIIWKSDLTDKMKCSFFQAAILLILLYGCTTWTPTKWLKKKLDGNYTRMLRAILNKSWRQPPQGTKYTANCLPSRKLYKLDEPDTQDTVGEARTNSSVMYSYGPPHMAKLKQDDQLEHTYSSYVRIWDVALKTCQKRWMIGRSGERGSGISVLTARHDDDIYIYIYIRLCVCVCVIVACLRWIKHWRRREEKIDKTLLNKILSIVFNYIYIYIYTGKSSFGRWKWLGQKILGKVL